MLERIHIENYKCLRDVTVDLGDFTILIGPNDAGKSSLLEVIRTLGSIIQTRKHGPPQGWQTHFTGDRSLANLVWRKDASLRIRWEATGKAAGQDFVYDLRLGANQLPHESLAWNGKRLFWVGESPVAESVPRQSFAPATPIIYVSSAEGPYADLIPLQQVINQLYLLQFDQSHPAAKAIQEVLASSLEYRLNLAKLPLPAIPKPGNKLESSGANLAAVLDTLQNSPDRSVFEALQYSLHEVIPTLKGIILPSAHTKGAKAIEYILAGNGQPPVSIPASLASGGALLTTAFLTLAHTETANLLLIEEPENGLHPYRLQMVLDVLRKMSRGELGKRKRQIVITTHNPLLLNYASPEEVRVFVPHQEGTKVIPMTRIPDIDRLLKEFALGELWYLLGEDKLFEAQPA